jgi:N-acyl-D-aspartate/D-glutamate deacylase
MEIISDFSDEPDELSWVEHIARLTGRPVTLLATSTVDSELWRTAARLAAEGVHIRPQVGARPASVLMTLEGTLNPLRQFQSFTAIKDLPIAEQRAALRDPAFRARLLEDDRKVHRFPDTNRILSTWDRMYVLPADLSYEPSHPDSLAGIAEARGVDVREVLMDVMADGRPLLFLFGGYPGHLDGQLDAIGHPQSVFGLSDGGAHCGVLCDASVPTYMLAYMARDRPRGTLPLEFVVHKMTQDSAGVYGITDRGVVAPGYRADLNLIDLDALRLHDPEMVYDLPAGGKRIIQRASGYALTVCAGEVTYEDGEHTGAMPGRLVRGGR